MNWCCLWWAELKIEIFVQVCCAAGCHVGLCLVLARPQNSLPLNSLINFSAIVSHYYSVISLALNNIFCPKKLSISCVYLAVACLGSWQQLLKSIWPNKTEMKVIDEKKLLRVSTWAWTSSIHHPVTTTPMPNPLSYCHCHWSETLIDVNKQMTGLIWMTNMYIVHTLREDQNMHCIIFSF